jgi:hypothetical protein
MESAKARVETKQKRATEACMVEVDPVGVKSDGAESKGGSLEEGEDSEEGDSEGGEDPEEGTKEGVALEVKVVARLVAL